jgi:hypothetical protein
MTDKEYREQKKRVKAYFDKWSRAVGLGWYRVFYEWDRARSEDDVSEVMKTTVSWHYREVTFYIRLPAAAELDDEHLEHVVVHELVHALTGSFMSQMDLSDKAVNQIMEFGTESIAMALIWAREAGKNDA